MDGSIFGQIAILIFVFLLAILLGLQIQITGVYRELKELRKDLKLSDRTG